MTQIENARRARAGVIRRAGGLFTTYDSRTSGKTQLLAGSRFEHLVRRVHALGERPLAELLVDIASATHEPGLIADRVKSYAALDPEILRALGADRFPPAILAVVP